VAARHTSVPIVDSEAALYPAAVTARMCGSI